LNALTSLAAQVHAADGLSAEAADALRASLLAMTVRAGRGAAAARGQHARAWS
jgi:hypothetical protein